MTLNFLDDGLSAESYAREIDATLPRILALFDRDPLSPTFGLGDRQYWAWKLIDFPNATFQGFVNGFSCLQSAGVLNGKISQRAIVSRIEEGLLATQRITRRDGSLEEAFPYERSYCVTALIAYDVLRAVADLQDCKVQLSSGPVVDDVVGPLVRFLKRSDETHGMISNHLATAVAALYRWDRETGDKAARQKADLLLKRILDHQSDEGWFMEYDGADPGYQTLCMSYLADVLNTTPSARLEDGLEKAVGFVSYFAHPDGSFGGLYGSRGTRAYYPAGVEVLAARFPLAGALAKAMRRSIANQTTVPLSAIDQPNLMPMFNNYCRALRARKDALVQDGPETQTTPQDQPKLPAARTGALRQHFAQAGLLIDAGPRHYSVISTHKGGVVAHWKDTVQVVDDPGAALRDNRGRVFTSQSYSRDNAVLIDDGNGTVTITADLRKLERPLPDPYRFTVLRLLNISVMRIPSVGELIKKALVRMLITAKRQKVATVTRTITLGPDLDVKQEISADRELRPVAIARAFSVIHMASQGYWQVGDDRNGQGGAE